MAEGCDALGDRMKAYESHESARKFIPLLPVYARIDGRNFSKFTRGMDRPYDKTMTTCMIKTTAELVAHTHARIGYTQSDEISLTWLADKYDSGIFFEGKVLKMASVLASFATAHFTAAIREHMPLYVDRFPHFDCRVMQMPNRTEVANAFLWRELDATKNAISMAARTYFSHHEIDHKTGPEMQEMLFSKGVNFNDYPPEFKRGTFVRRVVEDRTLSEEERAKIPERHRPDTGTLVTRSAVVPIEMPRFSSVENRSEVIFDYVTPIERKEF